jgi:uncharacterized protein YndB with AHSA1/START domain
MDVQREIVLPTTREDAWEALTEPSRLEEWFATEVELDLREGGAAVFRWGDGDARHAEVVTVEDEERLVLRFETTASVDLRWRTTRRDPRARPRVDPSVGIALELSALASWAARRRLASSTRSQTRPGASCSRCSPDARAPASPSSQLRSP